MDQRRGAYLEPDDDEIKETYHAELKRRISAPCCCVLDGHEVHEVQDELHRQKARNEAKGIMCDRGP